MVVGPTSETFRNRDLEIIYGENNTETTYKEYGCIFRLDIKKVFFSPRLSYERLRIADMVKAEETILNMFSGVGTFSIIIAKKNCNVRIFSIDINPDAYMYMLENVRLNHLEKNVIPILGDAKKIILNSDFFDQVDRVIMPLPDFAYKFLDVAIKTLKEGGTLHYYDVASDSNLEAIDKIKKEAKKFKRHVEIKDSRIVRSVGKRKYHIVIDAKII